MKNNGKIRYVILGMIISLILSNTMIPALAANTTKQLNAIFRDIKIVVDGVQITPKDANGNIVEPFVIDGTTYLPVRAIGEAFGKTLEWDGKTNTVYVGKKPGSKQYMFDIVPAYQSGRVVEDGWARYCFEYAEFSSKKSGGSDYFTMAGQKYTDGCYWQDCREESPFAIYNLNGNYKNITGILGHVDGTNMIDAQLLFYADGKLISDIPLTGDMNLQNVTIDVTGVLQLKIVCKMGYYISSASECGYGLGNVTIE